MYNACLREGTFPSRWKRQNLVLLPKPGKPPGEASSYRPICLLDTAAKILESLIARRLNKAIEQGGGLSPNQYGFRKARSTIDVISTIVDTARDAISGNRWKGGTKQYCMVVTLDIRNAFNSAEWSRIMGSLASFGVQGNLLHIVDSYFTNRRLRYSTVDGSEEYSISAGVPQGSVLGPVLWNSMYDGVLRLNFDPGTRIFGFADDIAVVLTEKELAVAEQKCNSAIATIGRWLSVAGLELAAHKTEAVLISSRKKVETASIEVGGKTITSKRAIKYLGVMLDTRLCFREHLEYTCQKALSSARALARTMLNTRGPKQERRLLLTSVTKSISLYAAPVWASALRPVYGKKYETNMWLYGSNDGRNLRRAVGLTALSQTYNTYLKRFGHEASDECTWCGAGIVEDARHIAFHCPRYEAQRRELESRIGTRITIENLVPLMLENEAAPTVEVSEKVPEVHKAAKPKVASPAVGAEPVHQQKHQQRHSTDWQKVAPKPAKRAVPKKRPAAILVQSKGGMSYSDMLKLVTRSQDAKLQAVGESVQKVRRTAKGDLLLELNQVGAKNVSKIQQDIDSALEGQVEAKSLANLVRLDVLEMDEEATKAELCQAVSMQLSLKVTEDDIKSLRPSYGGSQKAILCLPANMAEPILKAGQLKIGYSVCRVRAQPGRNQMLQMPGIWALSGSMSRPD
ncbi:uncharacterized protein [Drosophila tropicalis]|uniref:uncharacterized protein n=1 Tax=Drosophila tropicalis TaxID=46794 RepID=UPI0035AB9F72